MTRMEKVQHSQAYLRKRKMLTVLPLLVVPFLTFLFWALGGGRGTAQSSEKASNGLNLNLPNAALKDEGGMDKLSFYDMAQKDSADLAKQLKNDPDARTEHSPDTTFSGTNEIERITGQTATKFNQASVTTGLRTSPYSVGRTKPEDEIMQKLSLLQKELGKPAATKKDESTTTASGLTPNPEFSSEVDRLEQMMQAMNSTAEPDPEMQQLQTTLDKMLDVQHPERVRERIKGQSLKNKEKVFTLGKKPFRPSVSLLDTPGKRKITLTRFYGLEDVIESPKQTSAEAVIHGSQTLVNGAVIKFRLLDDIYINGTLIPAGAFVFGTVELNGERLEARITSIRYRDQLLPVKLEVYDMDGLPGIYIPGAITKEVAQSSVDNAVQMLEISSLDPSLKAQAASTGLNAVKSLLSKKAKLVKVLVKEGYHVLLKDTTNEQ